jgi:hypothetical protein
MAKFGTAVVAGSQICAGGPTPDPDEGSGDDAPIGPTPSPSGQCDYKAIANLTSDLLRKCVLADGTVCLVSMTSNRQCCETCLDALMQHTERTAAWMVKCAEFVGPQSTQIQEVREVSAAATACIVGLPLSLLLP